MKYDFHIHSIFSDGTESVENIFKTAKKQGLHALALTDHDTILNMETALLESKKQDIDFIPGIELTACEQGANFHVLGYGINPKNKELLEYSQNFLDAMNAKSRKQIKMLQNHGINISEEEFFEKASGGPLYRAKFLRVLADHGYLKQEEVMQSLSEYFGKDSMLYVKDEYKYPTFAKVCAMIKNSGGAVVLAHPGKIKKKNEELYYDLINSELLDGVEIFHRDNNDEVRQELMSLAMKKNYIVTGGSDYHGLNSKKSIEIGDIEVNDECYKFLKPFVV